jgi:hypothetical protein
VTVYLLDLPWWTCAAGGVLLLLLLGLSLLALVHTRRWHERYHRVRTELMCDHCTARFVEATRSHRHDAPPLRPSGSPRRRR